MAAQGCGVSPLDSAPPSAKELIPGGNHTHGACTASGHWCSAWGAGGLHAQALWWAAGAAHRSWTSCPTPCRLFPAQCVSHIFWTPMGAQKHPLSPREWVSPLLSSGHPKSLPALFLSSWPGVGRAAGQGGGGVGCALPVGPRAPPADEIHGAEPLHPLGQVSAPGDPPHPTMLEEEKAAALWSRSREGLSWGCRGLGCNQQAHQVPLGEEGPALAAG